MDFNFFILALLISFGEKGFIYFSADTLNFSSNSKWSIHTYIEYNCSKIDSTCLGLENKQSKSTLAKRDIIEYQSAWLKS